MERIALNGDLELSRIVYGMWRLAEDADTGAAHVRAKIDACLEQGITSFDQADIYGNYESQLVLGQALKSAPELRERIEIVSKADIALLSEKFPDRRIKHYDTGRAHILASVERSLAEMGLDYLDLLLIHRPDPLMDAHETGAVLDELVTTGKVRAVGVSNFRLFDWTLLQSAMKTPLVTNQIELSLLSSEPFRNGDLAFLQERGVPPMAWSPLAGGALFDGSHPELLARLSEIGADHGTDATAIAIAWLLRHPARIIPVLGTNNLNRIRSMSDALRVTLDRETWFELYELGNGFEVP
ncbi:MAG TPA: aldo/keto reductase [Paracoccus sp. (in: a-proteobacteria)]|uniref:aldo/keto reductase n=1 Tax=uncultured Paracoccus sp. TaxID=189685 RepID=UPI00262820DF|nr:aldo/keto reductase [uncultured Paracoccus sp.]HMQ41673.1 aldo/keto reductase [Paracoccus sp. (in: a-proteobacteria)]HMR36493.1 aldo/keto reductase [Paracoccus sp. (in: a-proteobacteria)]